VAAVALVAGAGLYAMAASQLVWPDVFSGPLSYGRLLPAATTLLVYGWLGLGAIAAAWYVLPRLGGDAFDARLAAAASLLVLVGALAGSAVIALGGGTGGRYLEAPWWTEAVVAAGLAAAAVAATRAAGGAADRLPVGAWYSVAALWWGAVALGIGAIPGLDGLPASLQARFAGAVVAGLAPTAAGLGVAYFLVSRLVPGASFHPRLGRIGFWSLGFAWLWLGPRELQYGPTPDWLETIPVLFAAGLVVAAIAVIADFAWALRGRWSAASGSRPLALVLAGLVVLAIVPLQMLVHSLRSGSAVIHFTYWELGLQQLLLFGAATFWLLALAAHPYPGRRERSLMGRVVLWDVAAGLAMATVASWIAGLQQGYVWVGSVNGGEVPNYGDGFRNSVAPLEGILVARTAGLVLIVLGASAAFLGVVGGLRRFPTEAEEPRNDGPTDTVRPVWQGAVGLILTAGLAVFGLPALEVDDDPSVLAAESRSFAGGSVEAEGRELYVQEGCWHCHTQQVRAVITDVGLGPVSQPGDYAHEDADVLGVARIGPDLMHAGGRVGTDTPAWIRDHLVDPRVARPWSTMPSYDYLSDRDLDALAAYIASLE
jgi:cbb3-type cytochrome oxidase subunit 1